MPVFFSHLIRTHIECVCTSTYITCSILYAKRLCFMNSYSCFQLMLIKNKIVVHTNVKKKKNVHKYKK